MIAAIYARKSTDDSDRDAEARSCERQIDGAKRYAEEQGWTVGPIFRDDAVSGAEWKHRDGWNRLLAALKPKPLFTHLVVSELSRIGRDSVRTPAAVQRLEDAGVETHSYMARSRISLADEAGEMSTMLHSLLASFERRRASARTRDAMRRRFEAGAATGPIYGYTITRNGDGYAHYVVDPVEADTVQRVFRLYDEGLGLHGIAARLNAAGIRAPRGGTWTPACLRLILRRSLVSGGTRVASHRLRVPRRHSTQARTAGWRVAVNTCRASRAHRTGHVGARTDTHHRSRGSVSAKRGRSADRTSAGRRR